MGNVAAQYARAFYEILGCDALTVNPYMGHDCVAPFTAYQDRTTFLVCLTSNPGADDFEKQLMGNRPLYERVIAKAHEWNAANNIGLVFGATQPEHLAHFRSLAPDIPLLIPGVGAQGGSIELAVKNGCDGSRRGHPHQLLARHPLRLPRQRFRGCSAAGDPNPARRHQPPTALEPLLPSSHSYPYFFATSRGVAQSGQRTCFGSRMSSVRIRPPRPPLSLQHLSLRTAKFALLSRQG